MGKPLTEARRRSSTPTFYINLETGMVRRFSWEPPRHGKWKLTSLRHERPPLGRKRFRAELASLRCQLEAAAYDDWVMGGNSFLKRAARTIRALKGGSNG